MPDYKFYHIMTQLRMSKASRPPLGEGLTHGRV